MKPKCKARTRKGTPCPYQAAILGYCIKHIPNDLIPQKSSRSRRR